MLSLACGMAGASALAEPVIVREVDAPPPLTQSGAIWPSQPPEDCPFKPSATLKGLRFTGRHAEYTHADTWYPSWAADGNLYSPFADGGVNGVGVDCYGPNAATGHATIVGDDPLKLVAINPGTFKGDPAPYEGRYPCANLVYNGIWYIGTYCLSPSPAYNHEALSYNWPWLGPFVGWRYSTDFGKTWTDTPHTPAKPLFGESGLKGAPLKIGSPHVVDFGKNMEHSPDGKAYLVCHGAVLPDAKPRFANLSWGGGDQIYLIRVVPSIENINDASKYEYFAGHDGSGKPLWTSDFAKIKPLLEWNNNMGCVTMTYNAPLKKYLMCVLDAGRTSGPFNTYILEADQITGPWKLVTYMKRFGEQAYFVNIPSKFISDDGRTLWLCYAANFSQQDGPGMKVLSRPIGGKYGMCLQEVKLVPPSDPGAQPNPLDSEDNIARQAILTASSTCEGYIIEGATDGNVGGYPAASGQEWASQGELSGALLRLSWHDPQRIDRIWLFDRPTRSDRVTSAILAFSDGTALPVGALPDDAKKGIELKFEPKSITWVTLLVAGTSPGSSHIGLSEIAVFRAGK